MKECGAENFTIEVIEYCENQDHLNERESFWIKVLNCKVPNGYNLRKGGGGSKRATERQVFTMRLPPDDYEKLKTLSKKINAQWRLNLNIFLKCIL